MQRCCIVLCARTLVPVTARGMWLKLKFPKIQAWAESFSWSPNEWRLLRVMLHCGIR